MNDYISKQRVLDIVHNEIYKFFSVCEDDEETPVCEEDKLLLEVNKAICNAIKSEVTE